MRKENPVNNETDANYLERPRLHSMLKDAMDYPLIIVCAGSGYGKTRAVQSFFNSYDAIAPWMQVSERDNIPLHIWESICEMSLMVSQEYSARLKEIGFPKTDEAFSKFIDSMKKHIAPHQGKIIGIFDDFHLLQNHEILGFFERMVNSSPSNMRIMLITRNMPDINLVGMNMRGKVFTIQEDMLRFTEDEIAKYFCQLNLPVTNVDIRNIYDDTRGWAFAINLIGRSLAKNQKYERYALEAMKKNIFRFIEAEIFQTIPQPLERFLMRIALLDRLSAGLVKTLANDEKLISGMERLNAYIRYDFNMDTYMIHHMLRDYLRLKQEEILTDRERTDTYETAAVWCNDNGYHLDAFYYYEKSANYDAITLKVASLNVEIPSDMAKYILDIFERALKTAQPDNPLFPAMYVKLKINMGYFDEAYIFAEQFVKDCEALSETPELNRALSAVYASWGSVRLHMCTYTDVYDFDFYFKKMGEYFDKSPYKLIGTYKLTSSAWSLLVGTNREGAMEEYIAAVSRSAPHLMHVMNGFYSGVEDLLHGELCFYKRQFNDAEQYLKQSIARAGEYDQYVTQNRALVYLMHIDFTQGDYGSATARLKEMESLLNEKDFGIRYIIYDIACGFYHLALEQPEQIPQWLKGNFSSYAHSSFLENYANRIKARYHYKTNQYSALLAFIKNSMKQPMILFSKIELLTLQALTFYQLKKRSEAIAAFTEAYLLSESNKIIASFTEHGKDMRTLTLAVHKDMLSGKAGHEETGRIPQKWLEDINRISSTYAKRKAKMTAECALANNLNGGNKLTKREIAILKDMTDGLSRTEIASNKNLSVNTIKMAVNIIYSKLGVSSLGEAIRAAIDQKLI
ncbi:MAG: LuxR C-terminal-related transcriptional regulator [Treponema sp.]|nr:LuxR C-terminal-related transcriptional regulator [Treponema sp.]